MTPFQWTRERLPARAASLLVVLAAQNHLEYPNTPSQALTNQQTISITVEAVAEFDGMLVGRQDMLTPRKSAH